MSDIGKVNLFGLNLLLSALEGLVVNFVSLIFSRGLPLGWILEKLGLEWVNLNHTELNSYYQYFILFTTPIFDLDTAADRLHNYMHESYGGYQNIEIKEEHI